MRNLSPAQRCQKSCQAAAIWHWFCVGISVTFELIEKIRVPLRRCTLGSCRVERCITEGQSKHVRSPDIAYCGVRNSPCDDTCFIAFFRHGKLLLHVAKDQHYRQVGLSDDSQGLDVARRMLKIVTCDQQTFSFIVSTSPFYQSLQSIDKGHYQMHST